MYVVATVTEGLQMVAAIFLFVHIDQLHLCIAGSDKNIFNILNDSVFMLFYVRELQLTSKPCHIDCTH